MNGEKLACKHDTREKAQLYDDYAVGIYLGEGELQVYVPQNIRKIYFLHKISRTRF